MKLLMDRFEICNYASKYDADYDTPMCRLAEDVKERGLSEND